MNILVIGEQVNLMECRQKFGDRHEYSWVEEHRDAEKFLQSNGLVFDFIFEHVQSKPGRIGPSGRHPNLEQDFWI